MSIHPTNIKDYENVARSKLSQEDFGYFCFGAGNKITLTENSSAFDRWRFQPLALRNVSNADLSTTVFGSKVQFPICIAPTAFHKKILEEGEVATAKAAESLGIGFVLSSFAHCSMEEIADEVPGCLRWSHIQVVKNRDFMKHFVERAEKCGFQAFVITIDQPVWSMRVHKTRDGKKARSSPGYPTENLYQSTKLVCPEKSGYETFHEMFDGKVTWNDISWFKNITKLKVILKGVLTAKAALEAVSCGVDGIIVSNHGGRQLDGVFATIDCLPEVVKAVDGKCDVYLDGGIRCGADIVKAIALGARAVFIGRPILWGLACGQKEGVRRVLEILRDEFKTGMQLLGVSSTEELQGTPGLVVRENAKWAKL